jgi:hypothetical protein
VRPRDIGTKVETAVVRHLQAAGFPHAERRALRGTFDAGDITGTPGLCWSVKGGTAAETASDTQIVAWLAEAQTQRVHAGADHAVLVLKRRAHSAARAGCWWAVLTVADLARLIGGSSTSTAPVRIVLDAACRLLRDAGYGSRADKEQAA